jgi:hypothetical protein
MGLLLDNSNQQRSYIKALLPETERQLPMVLEYHLIDMHSIEYWFELMKAATSTMG